MRKNFCAAWAVTICLAILILVPRTVVAKPGLLDIAEWPVTSSIHGGVLLLSDAPEYVGSEGIMYEDRAKGDIRIFFHHVNDLPDPVQVGVVLESIDGAPLSVTVRRVGISSPDPDYLRAGKQVQFDYFKDNCHILWRCRPENRFGCCPTGNSPWSEKGSWLQACWI